MGLATDIGSVYILVFGKVADSLILSEFLTIYFFFFFFFLNQQFVTRRARADRGSYFRNYVHKTHTNMK